MGFAGGGGKAGVYRVERGFRDEDLPPEGVADDGAPDDEELDDAVEGSVEDE